MITEPSLSDGVTFDANTFINYALKFGPIYSYFALPLHDFKKECIRRNIKLGYFKFIKDQSYRNLTYAVNEFAKTRGKKDYYIRMKFRQQAELHLDGIFSEFTLINSSCSNSEFSGAKIFFTTNQKDVEKLLNLQHIKSNIPEDHDIEFLVLCHKCNWTKTYLVSDDGHFIAYARDIEKSSYDVDILPMKDVRQKMIGWKWIN